MKNLVWGSLVLLVVAGCGRGVTVSGSDGEKVSVNPRTGDMTITDKDGTKVDIESKGDSWTAKSSDGTEMTMKDGKLSGKNEKGETFETGTDVSESELGLPFYPGSKAVEYGSSKIMEGERSMFAVNRTSSDVPDKVIEFYKSRVTEPQVFNSSGGGSTQAQISGKLSDGSEVAIIATRDEKSSETMVMITVQRKKSK